jgi:peptide/nickel transport system substrate-binding protein
MARSVGSVSIDDLVGLLQAGRMSRREFVSSGIALGLSLGSISAILAACGTSTTTATTGGTLTTGVVGAVGKFDPQGWAGFTSNIATNHIFQSLVRLNFDTSELEPCLATSWDTPDPLTYIYHLRKGVKFHNGDPFTADDVVFSTNRSKKVSWGSYALSNLDTITALDPYTVQVKLSKPDWRFKWFYYWPPGSILSKKYVEKVGEDVAAQKPVGTNAFKLTSSTSSQVVLEKFADYWEKGLPKVDKVVLRVLDGSTILSGLKTGEIQLSPDVGFDQMSLASSFSNVDIKSRVGPHIVMTYLNTTKAPFNDVKVRQAIAEALDNTAALSAYPAKYYLPSKGAWIHPSFEFSAYNETNAVYTSNLDKAKSILAQSATPNGFSTTWTVAATRPQELSAVLGAQERLAKIGIKVDIKQLPDPDVAGATYTRPRPFDMITYNWLHNQPHALDPMAALLTTDALAVSNFPGYSNPAYDAAVGKAIVATDKTEIATHLRTLQMIQVRDVPLLVHGWDGIRRVAQKKLDTPVQTLVAEYDDWFRPARLT